MDNIIPLSVPNLKGNELKYVTHAIETEWVSSIGKYIIEFEEKIAKYVNSKGAVACQNGTSGLHIALKVCEVLSGDEVIVPTLTFIAAVNPIKYCGAEPIFMDCDDSLTLDIRKLTDFCDNECHFFEGKLINNLTKRTIKAIVVVHVFGNMANMVEIINLAKKYNLKVIEDATEALGSYYISGDYKGRHAGTMGTIGVYSFNGNKIITTGGGGMVVSNDEIILKRIRHLTTQAKSDDLYYTHDEIGYNYRMTNIQAALGLAQLEQIEKFIDIKRSNYELYKEKIKMIDGLSLFEFNKEIRSNYWFYGLIIDSKYPLHRDRLIEFLALKSIQSRPLWGLIHEQLPYQNNQYYKIEVAKRYAKTLINIPCSSNLKSEEVNYVSDCLKSQV
ncbi:GDP-perosamine synthase [Petrocella atlantisensis]|uniref:GDP-perosamine synthase n=1 Tax=Petrocella atlantisensis TaxID=2173034 RepID=A0A3P7S1I4_9FIRM|nr:LegC family aminotransferase [Petrocella atlantisensis]VDN48542.1 GDP-perosamine synthase [Petrocella atlantisensis]